MSKSINEVRLLGNLGRDPELRHTGSGTAVCNLSIATSESYKDGDGNYQEKTEWHKVVAWNKQAEYLAANFHKGDKLHVSGKLQTRSYEKDGQKHYITEVKLTDFVPVGGKTEQPQPEAPDVPEEDDLPF